MKSRQASWSLQHLFTVSLVLLVALGLSGCGAGGGGAPTTSTNATTVSTPTALTLSLIPSRTTGVAPLGVFFDATATVSPATTMPFHEIQYTWSFGDSAGGATWAFGARPGALSKNVARGPVAGHLFETPGTYTVTLTAYDGANTSSQTATITVDDPNTVFGGTNTICVANGSLPVAGASGCPAGAAVQNLSTLAGVTALATGNKRVLLKRGDTWAVSATGWINSSNNVLGAYPLVGGPAPKIAFTTDNYGIGASAGLSNLVLMDLDFDGLAVGANKRAISVAGTNVTVLRATGTGLSDAVMTGGNNIFIVDSNFSSFAGGYGNVGIWAANATRLAILGTRVYDATLIEHNIRTQGVSKAVYSFNTIAGPATTKHALTIRGKSSWTEHVVVADNDISGGPAGAGLLVQIAPQNTASYEPIRDVLVERNYVWGDVGTGVGSEVCERATIRNNIFNFASASGTAHGIDIGFQNAAGVPAPTSHYIYNNSFYYAGTLGFNGVNALSLNGTYPKGTVVKNNLAYAPNATNDGYNNGSQGKLYAGNAPIGNYVLANNSSDPQIKLSPGLGATPPTATLNTWKPLAGSYAIGTGIVSPVLPVWDDFFANPRTGTHDMGAVLH